MIMSPGISAMRPATTPKGGAADKKRSWLVSWVELETKAREDFTISVKALLRHYAEHEIGMLAQRWAALRIYAV